MIGRQPGLSRRSFGALLGATTLGLAIPLSARMALASDGTTLRIAHLVLDYDWSPLRGGGDAYPWSALWWASPMYMDENVEIQPYVFVSWEPNEDKSVWTFKLDPNAKFSDGSRITADIVKSSWELAAMPTTKNQRIDQLFAGVQGYGDITTGASTELTGVSAPDEETVVVTLDAGDPLFDMRLANHLAPIVPPMARDSSGEEVYEWWHPDNGVIVSGPYRPVEMNLDAGRLAFEPNENFFGPRPSLARIEIETVEDPVLATTLLQSGEFDMHTELRTPSVVSDLGPEFISGNPIPQSHHFWLSANAEPTNDLNVRKALIMAVDRDGLLQATWPDGPHRKADQILQQVPGTDTAYEPYPFDPEAARSALAASSYGGAERLPRLVFLGIGGADDEAAAQFIAEQWRQHLGITGVDLKPQQAHNITGGGFDTSSAQIFRDDIGTRVPDAVAFLMSSIHSGSGNASMKMGNYSNKEVDELLEAASLLPLENPERNAMAIAAQRLFRDDWMHIPWYNVVRSRNAMPHVENADRNLDWQLAAPWALGISR